MDSFSRPVRALLAIGPMLAACSGEGPSSSLANPVAPSVDQAKPVFGAPDNGDDPAVVALDVGGRALCSGALIAADVVITARHCVSALKGAIACPEHGTSTPGQLPAASIRILVGDDAALAVERARGRAVVVPPTSDVCGADIALVLLDAPIDGVQSLTVRPTGAAKGDHVRSVAFGRPSGSASSLAKLVRDHVPVIDTTLAEILVGEGPCEEDGSGGPALDEATGQIVGVASRNVSGGAASSNAYTRTDAFLSFIQQTLAATVALPARGAGVLKAKKGSPDLGANCTRGADCAAGACVTLGGQRYCSRACGRHDPCPARFRCEQSQEGEAVCVEK